MNNFFSELFFIYFYVFFGCKISVLHIAVFKIEETPINKFPQNFFIFSLRLIIMFTMFTEKDS